MTPIATDDDIKAKLKQTATVFEAALSRHGAQCSGASPRLAEAMRYSLEAGGKRLRPALVLWSCELCGGAREAAMPAAVAMECVHTFSLIHDDLPAIDNDDMRRGKPTNHKRFGEAMAILAGDGLLALAFEVLARPSSDPATAVAMVRELASAAGWEGMIGGEAADVDGESQPPDAGLTAKIHAAKTARLLEASCRMGGLAARADEDSLTMLGRYGHELGLAFQIADDLLDLTATSEQLGKAAGKDESSRKQTHARLVGIEESRKLAQAAADRAVAALAPFGDRAAALVSLARFVVSRRS